MKRKVKRIIKGICFILIFAFIFSTFQRLLQGKWIWTVTEEDTGNSTSTWDEYRGLTEDTVEVFFVGTSHTFLGIDPMYIYDNSGITSYAVAGSGMHLDLTYLSMTEALKTQTPTTVFFDMSAIQWHAQTREERYHKVTNQMGWSLTKLRLAFDSGRKTMSPLDIMFPLFRYHSRWSELNSTDFQYLMNDLEETVVRGHYISYKAITANFRFEDEKDYTLSARYKKYLDEIVELCTDQGIELILYKIPSPSWLRIYSETASELAEEYGLPYLELYYKMDEIGLDINTDFHDSYDHLNQYGAEKLCDYLIHYMLDNCEVSDQRDTNQEWNEDLIRYKALIQEVKDYQLQELGE